jgi:hypothetical protein
MEKLKLIVDKTEINGKPFIYNRQIIKYLLEETFEEKYLRENIEQFYDWINPNINPNNE